MQTHVSANFVYQLNIGNKKNNWKQVEENFFLFLENVDRYF